MPFDVTLSPPSGLPFTVAYATADGTATGVADYTSASGTLTFGTGDTTRTITVAIAADTIAEGSETFTVTLSAPAGATLNRATATGTIADAPPIAPTSTGESERWRNPRGGRERRYGILNGIHGTI